jgi:hypothetical protein
LEFGDYIRRGRDWKIGLQEFGVHWYVGVMEDDEVYGIVCQGMYNKNKFND